MSSMEENSTNNPPQLGVPDVTEQDYESHSDQESSEIEVQDEENQPTHVEVERLKEKNKQLAKENLKLKDELESEKASGTEAKRRYEELSQRVETIEQQWEGFKKSSVTQRKHIQKNYYARRIGEGFKKIHKQQTEMAEVNRQDQKRVSPHDGVKKLARHLSVGSDELECLLMLSKNQDVLHRFQNGLAKKIKHYLATIKDLKKRYIRLEEKKKLINEAVRMVEILPEAHGQFTIEVSPGSSQDSKAFNSSTKTACFLTDERTKSYWGLTTFHLLDTDFLVGMVCNLCDEPPEILKQHEKAKFNSLSSNRNWREIRRFLFGPKQTSDEKMWRQSITTWYIDELNILLEQEKIECYIFRKFMRDKDETVPFKVKKFRALAYESVDFMKENKVRNSNRYYDAVLAKIEPSNDDKEALCHELFGSCICPIVEIEDKLPQVLIEDFYKYGLGEGGDGQWFLKGTQVRPLRLENNLPHYGHDNETISFLLEDHPNDFNEGHSGSALFWLIKDDQGKDTFHIIGMLITFSTIPNDNIGETTHPRCQSIKHTITELNKVFEMNLCLVQPQNVKQDVPVLSGEATGSSK